MNENYQRMVDAYRDGNLPWDAELPPPEVIHSLKTLSAGRVLDLGCGAGRAARYMASHGWQVEAVDFVPQAIELARSRSAEFSTINYHVGSILELDFLIPAPAFDFAVDVGCGHALDSAELSHYRDQLLRLLKPGALFLLFGRIRNPENSESERSGFDEPRMLSTFQPAFELIKAEYGETAVNDSAWSSAWYWWRVVG